MTTLYCFDMFWPCWNVQPSSPQAQGCSSWIHIAAFSGSGVVCLLQFAMKLCNWTRKVWPQTKMTIHGTAWFKKNSKIWTTTVPLRYLVLTMCSCGLPRPRCIHELLAIADVVISKLGPRRGHAEEHWRCAIGGPWTVDIADTRPGGLITSEALACGLMMDALPRLNPMLFLAIRIAACLH